MPNSRIPLLIVIALIIAGFFYFDLQHFLTLENLKSRQESLLSYRNAHPIRATLIYALIYIAVTALSLPGATLLTLAGGAISLPGYS